LIKSVAFGRDKLVDPLFLERDRLELRFEHLDFLVSFLKK
jgi:hypothetical protein